MKRFFLMAAAVCCVSGAFAQYTNVLDGEMEMTVSNAWTTSTVVIGSNSSNNVMNVVSNGWIQSGDVTVGATNASYNEISMTETSRWDIAGQLTIGEGAENEVSITEGSMLTASGLTLYSDNTLTLESGGSISNLNSMSIYSNATVSGSGTIAFGTNDALLAFYGANQTVDSEIIFRADTNFNNTLSYIDGELDVSAFVSTQFVNFANLTLYDSALTGSGTLDSFENISMTGGLIDPAGDEAGTLTLGGSFSSSGTTYRAQVNGVSASDSLIFTDATVDLSGLLLNVEVSGSSTGTVTILSATNGLSSQFASAEITARPLLYTATFLTNGNEIAVSIEADESVEISSQLGYAATESVRAGFAGMKNMVFTRTKQLRRNLVSTPSAIQNDVFLLTSTNAPAGAMGPGDQNKIFDMHVWLQQYGGQGSYDAIGASSAFTLNNSGTTIGADRMIGEALAVGLNYTYARSSANAKSNDDQLDSETYWVGAYAEWVDPEGLYVDGLLAYGYSEYDTERFADSYHGTASFCGYAFAASADVGQYYYYDDHLALSPYMGLQAMTLIVKDHAEAEDGGSLMQIDEIDRKWLVSSAGLKMRYRTDTGLGRIQLSGYGEWTYDFIQDDISTTLSSGPASVETISVAPDESGMNAGLGISWISTDYMEIGVGYNGRFSDHYEEHSASVMIDTRF